MAFITDLQLREAIANSLGKEPHEIHSTIWNNTITSCVREGYTRIKRRFLKLGYSVAEIDQWDSGIDYNLHLALFNALVRREPNSTQLGEWREQLEFWRNELDELTTLEVDGEIEEPANAQGSVGHGTLSTADDLVVMDPDDTRIGEVTEW